jgi:hypothetical protein
MNLTDDDAQIRLRWGKWLMLMLAAFAAAAFGGAPAAAQAVVGRCVDQSRNQSFAITSTGWMYQEQNPANAGQAIRDPSGMAYLRMPAVMPWQQAFFVSWRGELIEINPMGARMIGGCQLPIPANPYVGAYQPPVMDPNLGVATPNGFMPIPQAIANPGQPFAPPMITTESQALQCYARTGRDRRAFADCMVRAMAGQRERAAYDCARAGGGKDAVAICMVGALGGPQEQRMAAALGECRQRFGGDYSRYPLCLASTQVGGDAGKLLACVQQQGQTGEVTVMGTAMCYGAGSLHLNPEMQIVAQCAVATGGEPEAFAGCAGGQLTARELDKCFTNGVGGPGGCFGPNNDIVRGLASLGGVLAGQFGPSNTMVQAWNTAVNDLTHGPGPNNDVLRTFRNVGNEADRAAHNVGREIGKVLPRVRVRL